MSILEKQDFLLVIPLCDCNNPEKDKETERQKFDKSLKTLIMFERELNYGKLHVLYEKQDFLFAIPLSDCNSPGRDKETERQKLSKSLKT
jgi:hypothetical protein